MSVDQQHPADQSAPRTYADHVVPYAQAGWPCILPVPAAAKFPPPGGFTGADGRDTDPLTLVEFASSCPSHSIALRMPDGVIGIDVDTYDKVSVDAEGNERIVTKRGADTLAKYVELWGPLPPTWSSTARGLGINGEAGPGKSRILFFRVPPRRYAAQLGADVEIIQRHHRYVVVAPSPNPHALGPDGLPARYRWYRPDGSPAGPGEVPGPAALAELPAAWVQGLAEGATEQGPAAADPAAGHQLLGQLLADQRIECAEVTSVRLTALDELAAADAGSRHDTLSKRVYQLVQIAAHGHTGASYAVEALREAWALATAGEAREREFADMLTTAARKAVTLVGDHQVPRDPCLFIDGFEVPGAVADGLTDEDHADGEPVGPLEPPRWLLPREVIGTHSFDPAANLDQPLAQAVLERTYPLLRYAYDSHGWLLRGFDRWELHKDLTNRAVTLVAGLLPIGDPTAEKGSDEAERSARRARFNTNAGRSAIAKTAQALVDGGMHPCTVKLADLDSDPEILWAGGLPWNLRACRLDSPMQTWLARVDVATPHLQTAAVLPELRATPLWDAFLEAVWPDAGVRTWALRVLAVTLTGRADRALPILLGEQGRGKTQVINLLMSVLGSYAHAADRRLLNANGERAHQSIVFALKGRRLSFIDEGTKGGQFAEAQLKLLTGGGELTGNQMGQNPITFAPTHTLVLTANDEPVLTDPAIKARVRLIPCDGDPEHVRSTRAAIGSLSGAAWRNEAPGVLARMMTEAAAWLADPMTGSTEAAPEAVRQLVERLAVEQDPIRTWLRDETEPWPAGTSSRELYSAFVASCQQANMRRDEIPSVISWGKALTREGLDVVHTRNGNFRMLRVKPQGPWGSLGAGPADSREGSQQNGEGSVKGSDPYPSQTFSQVNHNFSVAGEGVKDSVGTTHIRTHADAHTHGGWDSSFTPSQAPIAATPARAEKPKRREQTEAARTKAAEAKAAKRAAAIEAASGEHFELPAVVQRSGAIVPVRHDQAAALLATLAGQPLTVDVETTGYPIGHRHYALRTVQLGNELFAVVLDPHDEDQRPAILAALAAAPVLHAHSATADLVPLEVASLLEHGIDEAWERMHDTVIPAKLADPASTGSDPSLKKLAPAVLGAQAVSPAADEARAALFKAHGCLTETKVDTELERSGWAQVDSGCTTMLRYAASDVLDDAALARRMPWPAPRILERERLAQRMTGRVAHTGLRLDGEQVDRLYAQQLDDRADAAQRLADFGVDSPGSNDQVAAAVERLGLELPRTKTGKPSVAAGVLERHAHAEGDLGDLIRARLDYQTAKNRIGLFLEGYRQAVVNGDGRVRPTVYTMEAKTGRMSCVQSDALIEMPRDLTKYPNGVPITEVKAGDLVYAFDHHRELVLRRVKWCDQTGVRQTYTITAESRDGHRITLRATEDHLIRLYNGDWRATENLMHQPGRPHRDDGPRLMTMVRRHIDDGYAKFYPHANAKGNGPNGGGRSREHRWVAGAVRGKAISTKWDVNHIDGNRLNNHPDNLQPMPAAEHRGNRDLAWGVEQQTPDLPTGSNDYRVVSVVPALIEPVWDMEVEDVHNFIANGICVHNCVRPNLQQVPREGGFRACITADPGNVLISADFASVELRVAAALSQDPALRAILEDPDRDIHAEIARIVWGPGAGKSERYMAKRKVFGRIYGSGINGLVTADPPVSESTARAIVHAMDQMTPGLSEWSRMVAKSVEAGHTQFATHSGRVVHMPADRSYAAPNYCIQGTARELLIDALELWSRTPWGGAVLLPVHDELVVQVPEDQAEAATAALTEAMATELFGVAIVAEASEPSFEWKDSS